VGAEQRTGKGELEASGKGGAGGEGCSPTVRQSRRQNNAPSELCWIWRRRHSLTHLGARPTVVALVALVVLVVLVVLVGAPARASEGTT